MPAKKVLTEAEIEAGKGPKGGYTREQLAQWGGCPGRLRKDGKIA